MKAKIFIVGWIPKGWRWSAFWLLLSAAHPAYGQAGSLDSSYQPNPSSVVDAVAIQTDGKAVIGGSFGTVGGFERHYLARLNTNGTVDAGFIPANIENGEV